MAAASTASKAELALARFRKAKPKALDNDDPDALTDDDKWKDRRAALNRRATKIKNAPEHVQKKWDEIQNLGTRQNKLRLQQEFEEHLMKDTQFSDSYWAKELSIDVKKSYAETLIWQVREEVETKLGGKHAVDRLIDEGYFKTRMAGPKGNIQEVARVKQVNSRTVERGAKVNIKIGGNITNSEQLKDRLQEFEDMCDNQFGSDDEVKKKPAGKPDPKQNPAEPVKSMAELASAGKSLIMKRPSSCLALEDARTVMKKPAGNSDQESTTTNLTVKTKEQIDQMSDVQNTETNTALKNALSQMRSKDMALLHLNIRLQDAYAAEGSSRAQIKDLQIKRLADLREKCKNFVDQLMEGIAKLHAPTWADKKLEMLNGASDFLGEVEELAAEISGFVPNLRKTKGLKNESAVS